MKYEKPSVILQHELAEGVYMASGSLSTTDGGPVCQSKYMLGVWHKPKRGMEQGTRLEVWGCEGCSADDGDGCKILKNGELNPDGVFMPTWEQQGLDPNEVTW